MSRFENQGNQVNTTEKPQYYCDYILSLPEDTCLVDISTDKRYSVGQLEKHPFHPKLTKVDTLRVKGTVNDTVYVSFLRPE